MKGRFYTTILSMLCFACASKDITHPMLAEAVLIVPEIDYDDIITWAEVDSHNEFVFKDHTGRIHFFGSDADYGDYVPGEKYILIYDREHPGWWEFDKDQCGPFFYPDESVDTTIGKIVWSRTYKSTPGEIEFAYSYKVGDSSFKKYVSCSDPAKYKPISKGKEFKVIYSPHNKLRAKMLFEPEGYVRELPKRDTFQQDWWRADQEQCGTMFGPNERVGTTIGTVKWFQTRALYDFGTWEGFKLVTLGYTYTVGDSTFNVGAICRNKVLCRKVNTGKKFKVLYDPNNKGRSQILSEQVNYKQLSKNSSSQTGSSDLEKAQCQPSFYQGEKVDTTTGTIDWINYYGENLNEIYFFYKYRVLDTTFHAGVHCSNTSEYENVSKGKEFKVIYDSNNKGRARILLEQK